MADTIADPRRREVRQGLISTFLTIIAQQPKEKPTGNKDKQQGKQADDLLCTIHDNSLARILHPASNRGWSPRAHAFR